MDSDYDRPYLILPDFIHSLLLFSGTYVAYRLQPNKEELNILLSDFNPILVSLQETFLKPDKTNCNEC